jgi:hypothetical protein
LEKPCFLFLEGSSGTTVVPAGTYVAPIGASTDDPVTGAYAAATGTSSTASSATRGDGGGGFHLSEATRPPSLSSSSSDDESAGACGGERPCCSQPILLIVLFQAFPPPDFSLLRARRPLPFSLLRGVTGRSGPECWRVRP